MYLFLFFGILLAGVGVFMYLRGQAYTKQTIQQIETRYKEQIEEDIEQNQKECDEAIRQRLYEQERAQQAKYVTEQLLQSEQERMAAELKRRKELDEIKYEQEKEKKQKEMDLYFFNLNQQATEAFEEKANLISSEIEYLESKLNDFKAKQDAINEAIRRAEELQNEMDMHRIILTDNNKEDISYLVSIEQNIHNKDLLYKLIWSEYIQKPFNQMTKNIFGNRSPKNVIYCIENITTHKKYIGKTSAEVTKRWTDHLKNSLNIGGIKRQPIHDALFGHWDEFTFSVVEEVKDDKLSEREKYYISFFETDKYGYNVKGGG